ncbi:MAG: radical SAM protein [Spirochaetes bacterium]|nr:radical SAM protein [Spirochaetota bacterium]
MMKLDTPRLIFWELTKRCNLKCVHCRAEAEDDLFEGELDLSDIKRIMDDIASFASPIMVLTGGEPLFRNDLFEIARHGKEKGLRLALATNGTMVDSDKASRIKAYFDRVSISIDGKDSASHDGFRGIPGSFESALNGAGLLREAGVEFQFNTTITKRNADELEDIVQLSERSGAKALHIFMLVPVGCGVELAESEMLSMEKYEEVLSWLYERMKKTKMEFKATCAPPYYRIIRQKAREEGRKITVETDGMAAVTRGCLAGSGVCFISHRGDVQPCGYLPLVAGNVKKIRIREIWEKSPLFLELRDLHNLKGKCGICEYRAFCAGCRARAYYEYGDYLAEEPYCIYQPIKSKK